MWIDALIVANFIPSTHFIVACYYLLTTRKIMLKHLISLLYVRNMFRQVVKHAPLLLMFILRKTIYFLRHTNMRLFKYILISMWSVLYLQSWLLCFVWSLPVLPSAFSHAKSLWFCPAVLWLKQFAWIITLLKENPCSTIVWSQLSSLLGSSKGKLEKEQWTHSSDPTWTNNVTLHTITSYTKNHTQIQTYIMIIIIIIIQ